MLRALRLIVMLLALVAVSLGSATLPGSAEMTPPCPMSGMADEMPQDGCLKACPIALCALAPFTQADAGLLAVVPSPRLADGPAWGSIQAMTGGGPPPQHRPPIS
ncbi:hypothetical protein [Inquilinus sp. Marseille-Q2685]|uniref:hypothetical protein n=1 Tax=Inquilinus sp. Marseille-Q2685 TaxID=2866581 RepID=UPI001CE3B93B|nr:hypothetical protein [Inquilinus sp. Marseille-Q2685]